MHVNSPVVSHGFLIGFDPSPISLSMQIMAVTLKITQTSRILPLDVSFRLDDLKVAAHQQSEKTNLGPSDMGMAVFKTHLMILQMSIVARNSR